MERFPAIILAGGRGTRLGGVDKALVDLAGQTLLARVIARLRPQCAPLAISWNGAAGALEGYGLAMLPDACPDRPGPLAGILAGLDWAAGLGAPAIISAATDTPFLPSDLAARLLAAAGPSGLALAASREADGTIREHPTFGLWPVTLRDPLRAALERGQRRLRSVAGAFAPGSAIWQAAAHDPFFNINTPDDLARAKKIARAGAA